MSNEEYNKANECCKTLNCGECPLREKSWCQELLECEKDDTESLEMDLLNVMIDSWSKDNVPECVKTAIKEVIREKFNKQTI